MTSLYDQWQQGEFNGGGRRRGAPAGPMSYQSGNTATANPATSANNTGPGIMWINPMTGMAEELPPGVTPEMALAAMGLNSSEGAGIAGQSSGNVIPGATPTNPYNGTGGGTPNTGMVQIGPLIQPPAGTDSANAIAAGIGGPAVAPSWVYNMNPQANVPTPGPPQEQVSALLAGQVPVNANAINQNIWDNPQLAISLGGVATPGTPGYNNLANMGFDPMAVYLASGGSLFGTTGVEYASWLANLYKSLGSRGDQGGGSINAGALLQNLVNMPANSDVGKMMSDDPTVFYQMASQLMDASGASPMAVKAFKSTMAQLYQDYITYTATIGNGKDIQPINVWMQKTHPDIVASWAGMG